MVNLTFITGNQNKADYLAAFLGIPLAHTKIDLDEIQSLSLSEIVTHKAKQAFDIIQKPVLVEDASLEFAALGGLPGPFIKFFVEQISLEKVCDMIGDDSRAATARSTFGYYDGTTLKLIQGSLDGSIALRPAGDGGYGWDTLFIPKGSSQTQAQLSPEEYRANYEKIKGLKKLKQFIGSIETDQ